MARWLERMEFDDTKPLLEGLETFLPKMLKQEEKIKGILNP